MTFDERNRQWDSMREVGDLARSAQRSALRRAFVRLGWFAVMLFALTTTGTAGATALHVHSSVPLIKIVAPVSHGNYGLDSRVLARFSCRESGSTSQIATCKGTVPKGEPINTDTPGLQTFTVTARDTRGATVTKTAHYTVLPYMNPLKGVHRLLRGRIDQGVDYGGWGPILAIGSGTVLAASNHDRGWPGHGWLLYELSQGRFAGRYVYVAENIIVRVKPGQTVTPGERIATLHAAFPHMETGWASDIRDTTLANADGHLCPGPDAGGWSTIEGRNFNNLLVVVGAPSGYLQPRVPKQHMPPGWPKLRRNRRVAATPASRTPLAEGWMARWK